MTFLRTTAFAFALLPFAVTFPLLFDSPFPLTPGSPAPAASGEIPPTSATLPTAFPFSTQVFLAECKRVDSRNRTRSETLTRSLDSHDANISCVWGSFLSTWATRLQFVPPSSQPCCGYHLLLLFSFSSSPSSSSSSPPSLTF